MSMTFQTQDSPTHWWHPRSLADGHTLSARVGPLALDISRAGGEWRIAWTQGEEERNDTRMSLHREEALIDVADMERHVSSQSGGTLCLRPSLLDKSVVIRPRQPVYLPPGESTTLYLSTPVSIRVEVGEPAVVLREIPVLRLSDTWFGPNTREGEFCYFSRTHARHDVDTLLRRPHRIVTPLNIQNQSLDTLPLEKVSLPVTALSVYGATDGSLWSQTLCLIRSGNTDHARLEIEQPPERVAGPLELLSGPRRIMHRSGLVRAFGLVFGH